MDIKVYKPDTELDFGNHRGFTIQEVLDDHKERGYIIWATLNVDWFVVTESVYSQLDLKAFMPKEQIAPMLQFFQEKSRMTGETWKWMTELLLNKYHAAVKHNQDLRQERVALIHADFKYKMSDEYLKNFDIYADLGLTRIKT